MWKLPPACYLWLWYGIEYCILKVCSYLFTLHCFFILQKLPPYWLHVKVIPGCMLFFLRSRYLASIVFLVPYKMWNHLPVCYLWLRCEIEYCIVEDCSFLCILHYFHALQKLPPHWLHIKVMAAWMLLFHDIIIFCINYILSTIQNVKTSSCLLPLAWMRHWV